MKCTHLAENGVREVNLLGQNVNGYRGSRSDGRLVDLAELLRAVAAIDGIDRIRYTTSHPLEFSDALIQGPCGGSGAGEVQLHLPVQSGSDRILAAMKRNHTALEYKSRIRKLRAAVPDIMRQLRLHRRLPRRNRERLRADPEADRRGRLRLLLFLRLQRPPRYAGG